MTSHEDGDDDDDDDDDDDPFEDGFGMFCQVESDAKYELLCACTHDDDDDELLMM